MKICYHNQKFSTISDKQKKNSKIITVQEYSLNFVNDNSICFGEKSVKINRFNIDFEINPGAACKIVIKKTSDNLFSGRPSLVKSHIKIGTYTAYTFLKYFRWVESSCFYGW